MKQEIEALRAENKALAAEASKNFPSHSQPNSVDKEIAKKLKKREKRNQQLMEEAMKHAMEAKVPVSVTYPVPLLTNNLFVVKSKTVRLSWY